MPLSDDSRALLQLLLGRGKSYADISGLLGIDEAEVRERARNALAEIDPSEPAPDADFTDYLLGQSDAITRAEVATRIGADPALDERANALADQLRLLAPSADLPAPSAPARKPATATSGAAPAPARRSDDEPSGLAAITGHQRRLIAVLIGGALLAAVVILLVTGVIGGSDDGDGDKGTGGEPAPTVAVLEPVSGQEGSGQVQFGFAGTSLAANMQISGLKPNEKGQGYALWLHGSTGAFPFYAQRVGKSGAITGQLTDVNEAVICLIASDFFPNMRVSRVNNKDFTAALKQSNLNRRNAKLPEYTGDTVLEGQISMPQAAKDAIVPACNGSAQQN